MVLTKATLALAAFVLTTMTTTSEATMTVKKDKDGMQSMSFKPPQMTEEMEHSYHMPAELKCDGCLAIAYQMHEHFQNFHSNYKSQDWRIPEEELIDLMDNICQYRTFEQYGIAADDDKPRIKGKGVYEAPGAAHMGGKIPMRIADMCGMYRDAEETVIYKNWIKGGRVQQAVQNYLCFNTDHEFDVNLNLCGKENSDLTSKYDDFEKEKVRAKELGIEDSPRYDTGKQKCKKPKDEQEENPLLKPAASEDAEAKEEPASISDEADTEKPQEKKKDEL